MKLFNPRLLIYKLAWYSLYTLDVFTQAEKIPSFHQHIIQLWTITKWITERVKPSIYSIFRKLYIYIIYLNTFYTGFKANVQAQRYNVTLPKWMKRSFLQTIMYCSPKTPPILRKGKTLHSKAKIVVAAVHYWHYSIDLFVSESHHSCITIQVAWKKTAFLSLFYLL